MNLTYSQRKKRISNPHQNQTAKDKMTNKKPPNGEELPQKTPVASPLA
jgi:hypothetical protein